MSGKKESNSPPKTSSKQKPKLPPAPPPKKGARYEVVFMDEYANIPKEQKMNFVFKEKFESVATNDFWYDLTDGGYITPKNFLAQTQQIKEVNNAIKLLMDFRDALEREEMLEFI